MMVQACPGALDEGLWYVVRWFYHTVSCSICILIDHITSAIFWDNVADDVIDDIEVGAFHWALCRL